jgi:low temperature requirement protein LtrA
MVTTFCASFVGAFLVAFAIVYFQRPGQAPLALRPLALGFVAAVAIASVMAALGLLSWESMLAAAGLGVGTITGLWLGALRRRSPG